jgi:hypothetical protein
MVLEGTARARWGFPRLALSRIPTSRGKNAREMGHPAFFAPPAYAGGGARATFGAALVVCCFRKRHRP